MELRIKQDFENQAAFLLKFMPQLTKVYTHQTLGKMTQKYLKKEIFRKEFVLFRENDADPNQSIYFIAQGQLQIIKKVEYVDQHGKILSKDEVIKVIGNNEMVGDLEAVQEGVQPYQCTVKVISDSAEVFVMK